MNLEERSNQIFMTIIHDSQETTRGLREKFALSRGQLDYDLKKINEWLLDNQLEKIERTRHGYFIVPKEVKNLYRTRTTTIDERDYTLFSPQERIHLLELMLLSSEEYMSLNHFIDALELSKNTVLRTLKALELELLAYELILRYSRAKGYYIEGREWDKRQLLRDTLGRVIVSSQGAERIIEFAQLAPALITTYQKRFEQVEQQLLVRYTDDQMLILPYFFALLIRRIKSGKTVKYNFAIDTSILRDTSEYQVLQLLTEDIDQVSEDEQIYLTLQLLATNVSTVTPLSPGELERLRQALDETLTLFEQSTAILIEHRQKLLNQLMTHMKPAYYRIKYQLNLKNQFYEANKTQLSSLFFLVERSLEPLSCFFQCQIPEVEIFFITLIISSHILGTIDETTATIGKAAIVCPNGISISALLEKTLRKLLPELDFLPIMSVRTFLEKEPPVEYVFSSVPIETSKHLFVVNSFLTEKEKRQLRQRVLEETQQFNEKNVTPEKIIRIVKKYSAINDETSLYHDLMKVINLMDQPDPMQPKRLADFLPAGSIQIITEEKSWCEVLTLLGQPLLNAAIITPTYIERLCAEVPILPAYMVLRETVALPHTEAENGALGVGMSLGIVKEGLPFADKKIHLVVLLASNDKEQHVDAILELMELAGNQAVLKAMIDANTEAEVAKLLSAFSENYWREQNGSEAITS